MTLFLRAAFVAVKKSALNFVSHFHCRVFYFLRSMCDADRAKPQDSACGGSNEYCAH
jgi:hypothetical protein